MKKILLVAFLTLVLLIAMIGIPAAAQDTPDVLMGFCLDESGSVTSDNWNLIKSGLASAIGDETIMPRDGSVEICIVKFSTNVTEVMEPTLVTEASIDGILATINGMPYLGGMTNIGDGLAQTVTTMQKSSYFNNDEVWKVINLATDGVPNQYPSGSGYTGYTWAEHNVDLAVAAGIDEIDAEGITDDANTAWLAQMVAYPDGTGAGIAPIIPDDNYPPRPPDPNFSGFVRYCETFEDYEEAVAQKLILILKGQLSLTPESATNFVGEQHCVTATLLDGQLVPMEGETIDFEVTGANPTTGSEVTDENGEAEFCYIGNNQGEDSITAEWDDSEGTGQVLNAGPVSKTWTIESTPVVGGDVYPVNKGMMAIPFIVLAAALVLGTMLVLRRRNS
jgi:uncharacterized protein YegL